MRLAVALCALILLTLCPARGDDLRPGYLEWIERTPDAWQVTWKAPLLGGLATRSRPILPAGCIVASARRRFVGPTVVETFTVRCTASLAGRKLGLAGLETGFTDALLHVAPIGQPAQAARLTPQQSEVAVAARGSRAEVAWTYLRLGFGHILFGFDHLLFVVALVLLIGGWRRLVATVTAFTVAHSITLATTTLGLVTLARKPVEICIALSIVLVAREILRPPHAAPPLARRAPALIAFAFGLLHGFGFAAALAEIGLPAGEIPLALFTFNAGVELGQLAIVATTLALIAALERLVSQWRRPAAVAGAYAIGAVATAWLIERTLA
ncbi:HupE/UreJ family protein [Novosphingobium sp. Gsoil 351]|uniref:HupE/UreJ family protein n=1 Tax=Novosphingobium sp. Gsoil 351 TaxID=2675225 RepID=UPI0012B4C558|nr:HupE/UreJ family protein [Novosphingobium sp. Gsoil 351]QGN53708.1 HupE/UreJ family protein [Novosphingobium sp. Gsoil 351]